MLRSIHSGCWWEGHTILWEWLAWRWFTKQYITLFILPPFPNLSLICRQLQHHFPSKPPFSLILISISESFSFPFFFRCPSCDLRRRWNGRRPQRTGRPQRLQKRLLHCLVRRGQLNKSGSCVVEKNIFSFKQK